MKVTRFVLALILAFSIMSVPIAKAEGGGVDPQDGNETRGKCPNGYKWDGTKCVKITVTPQVADPGLAGDVNQSTDVEDIIFMQIVNGVLFFILK